MRKFICCDCGRIFDEDEVATWKESRGEYWGEPCYETMSGCPSCQCDYVETYECACCGEWIEGSYIKLESGERICENCYTEYNLGDEG